MKAQVLLVGAILTPRKRVVSEVLRVMGLSQSRQFAQYHQVLNDPTTVWQSLNLTWYNRQQHSMEVASGAAVWFHNGKPPVPIRWVLLRDPAGKYDAVALLCTGVPTRSKVC